MVDFLNPDEPESPKLDLNKREDWKTKVGKSYWTQFEKNETRSQNFLFSHNNNSEAEYWKPPVPISDFAFVDDDWNYIVTSDAKGVVHLNGLMMHTKDVEKYWRRLSQFLGQSSKLRTCYRYKEQIKACAGTVQFFEERYPDMIPRILADDDNLHEAGEPINPTVPQSNDDDSTPF